MATRLEFQQMAYDRLNEAEVLYQAKHYNGSHYLAGYAAEFALKAAICRAMDIEMFDTAEVLNQVSKPLKIHNLKTLLVYSGLFRRLQTDRLADLELDKAWSIVSAWTEERRYEAQACSSPTANRFLKAVEVFLQWIKKDW
ncbi:MAG: HEPN domain-containing protein [Cytophagaceae bacterium]|nr:MAG: HEPN domain-containing protein [Cytophagaceae bacterium]